MHRRFAVWSAAIAIAVALLLAGCGRGDGDDPTYSSDTRASFLEPCIAGLGEEGRDVCECSYALIVDDIPFEDFQRLDRDLQGDPDAELPDAIADIVAACAADPTSADEEEEETTTTPLP